MESNVKPPKDFEPEIIDEESYSWTKPDELSPRNIILNHINRISTFIFKGGLDSKFSVKGDFYLKEQDRRLIIIQAIDFLIALLQPFYDKKMEEIQKDSDKDLVLLDQELTIASISESAAEYARQKKGNFQNVYKKKKEELKKMPSLLINTSSNFYEGYIHQKYGICISLFKEMNFLLHRINYLEVPEYSE